MSDPLMVKVQLIAVFNTTGSAVSFPALSQGLHERSLNQAIKCKKTVESYKEADIPNKDDILANLHSCIGNAYLEMGKYEQALENHQKDLSIANER